LIGFIHAAHEKAELEVMGEEPQSTQSSPPSKAKQLPVYIIPSLIDKVSRLAGGVKSWVQSATAFVILNSSIKPVNHWLASWLLRPITKELFGRSAGDVPALLEG